MKKIFFLVAVLGLFSSCGEDIQFNNPSLQVMKDDALLRTTNPRVVLNLDGTIAIAGEYGMESLSLKIPSVTPGTYYFGVDSNTVAYYRSEAPDGLVLEYSTIEGPENENEGNLGELTIYEITDPKASPVQGTISGEFKFRGRIMNNNPFGQPSVFFHKGHFYNLTAQAEQEEEEEEEEIIP
ncbi:MAG: DUF6252 family protein [Flavobacteriaceae bacterium]